MRAGIDALSDLPRVVLRFVGRGIDDNDATLASVMRTQEATPGMSIRFFYTPAKGLGILDFAFNVLVGMARPTHWIFSWRMNWIYTFDADFRFCVSKGVTRYLQNINVFIVYL